MALLGHLWFEEAEKREEHIVSSTQEVHRGRRVRPVRFQARRNDSPLWVDEPPSHSVDAVPPMTQGKTARAPFVWHRRVLPVTVAVIVVETIVLGFFLR